MQTYNPVAHFLSLIEELPGRSHVPAHVQDTRRRRDIELRFADLKADLSLVSEVVTQLPCLEVTTGFHSTYDHRFHPPVRTGVVALQALLARDFQTFGELVHAELMAKLEERAADEIDDEDDAA